MLILDLIVDLDHDPVLGLILEIVIDAIFYSSSTADPVLFLDRDLDPDPDHDLVPNPITQAMLKSNLPS